MGHTSSERIERLNKMLGTGLDKPLLEVAEAFPTLNFTLPDIMDSRELSVEADAGGINVKVFIGTRYIQIELRARNKEQRAWLKNLFNKLGCKTSLRKDNVFLPEKWKGTKNMAFNSMIAIERVKLLLEIVKANRIEDLSTKAKELL